ncbi:MAG TPA: MarR family transcriptional regulator, partial [Candidatus Saccharimonadales bacterium]|nr:MarR family transcriptional regulator [Candidatus Saccharimonadales bacterium]
LTALHRVIFQHQAWQDIQRQASVTLDRTSYTLLKVVASHREAPCRLQAVAQYLGVEAPSVTRTVQALEQARLVARRADPTDGRASIITISKRGERQLAKLQAARREWLRRSLGNWSERDLATFGKLLQRFADDLTNTK